MFRSRRFRLGLALDEGMGLATAPSSAVPMGRRRKAYDVSIRAAGIILVTPNGLALFLRRSSMGDHAGEWGWPGGKIEDNEESSDAALRETREETGWKPRNGSPQPEEVDSRESAEGVDFTTFRVEVDVPFIPTLDGEHDAYSWAPLSDPPQPVHPGVAKTIEEKLADDGGPGSGPQKSETKKEKKEREREARRKWFSAGMEHIEKSYEKPDVSQEISEDEWQESKHPRDEDGKFGSGSGGSETKSETSSASGEGISTEAARKLIASYVGNFKAELAEGHAKELLNPSFVRRHAPQPEKLPLSVGEAMLIMQYSGDVFLKLNSDLRSGSEKAKAYAEALNKALDKLPSYQGTTFRELNEETLAKYKPGDVITESGFTSTSKGASTKAKIAVHGKSGKDISRVSRHGGEAEVLFKAGTKFEVESVKDGIVTLKEVGQEAQDEWQKYKRLIHDALLGSGDEFKESDHPRGQPGNAGQFGPGGGGEKAGTKTETKSGKHPGKGYSDKARLVDGKIHTSDVHDAARALYEKRDVVLDQPREVSTLIDHIGKLTKSWAKLGSKAPIFDLCKVSIKGTNLFCADSHGISRVKMPQLKKGEEDAFNDYLREQKYEVHETTEQAAYLRATQNELNGARVSRIIESLKKKPEGLKRQIAVSRDNYILDGHHFWAARIGMAAADNTLSNNTKINIARVDIDVIGLLHEAENFTKGKGKQAVDNWKESDHPRGQPDNAGQFGPGGGGAESSSKSFEISHEIVDRGRKMGLFSDKKGARKLAEDLTAGIPDEERGTLTVKWYGGEAIRMVVKSFGVRMMRSFQIRGNKLSVYHDFFSIDSKYQHKGHAKKMLRSSIQAYEKLGVADIEMDVGEVGGYVWAKCGFVPGNAKKLREELTNRLDHIQPEERNFNKDDIEKAQAIISDGKIEDFAFDLAHTKVGKAILPYTNWYGYLNMRNERQLSRLKKEVGA